MAGLITLKSMNRDFMELKSGIIFHEISIQDFPPSIVVEVCATRAVLGPYERIGAPDALAEPGRGAAVGFALRT